jgi:predicted translin family RNA/ssDNA-binding protein
MIGKLLQVAEPIAPPKQAKEEASEQTGEISPAVAALKREIAQTKELVMLSKVSHTSRSV